MFKLKYYKDEGGYVCLTFNSGMKVHNPLYEKLVAVDLKNPNEAFPISKLPTEFESWEKQLEAVSSKATFGNLGCNLVVTIPFKDEPGTFIQHVYTEKGAVALADYFNRKFAVKFVEGMN